MANLRSNLDTAMFKTLNVQAITDVATGGVHNSVAPPNIKAPYVIFQAVSKLDEHSFSGRFGNAVYIVKAISKSPWPKEAGDVDTQIDTALEDAALSITGYTLLYCRRESDFYAVEEEGSEVWQHVGGYYRVIADQT